MKGLTCIAITLTLASSTLAIGQQMLATRGPKVATAPAPHFSGTDVKRMAREAHTPEQFQALATYYRGRQKDLRERARGEFSEALRRSPFSTGNRISPVALSMNRYQMFSDEARQAAQEAAHFEELAGVTPGAEKP